MSMNVNIVNYYYATIELNFTPMPFSMNKSKICSQFSLDAIEKVTWSIRNKIKIKIIHVQCKPLKQINIFITRII